MPNEVKTCPFCNETIDKYALVCPVCGEDLPYVKDETQVNNSSSKMQKENSNTQTAYRNQFINQYMKDKSSKHKGRIIALSIISIIAFLFGFFGLFVSEGAFQESECLIMLLIGVIAFVGESIMIAIEDNKS